MQPSTALTYKRPRRAGRGSGTRFPLPFGQWKMVQITPPLSVSSYSCLSLSTLPLNVLRPPWRRFERSCRLAPSALRHVVPPAPTLRFAQAGHKPPSWLLANNRPQRPTGPLPPASGAIASAARHACSCAQKLMARPTPAVPPLAAGAHATCRLTPRCSGRYPGIRPGSAAELIHR